MGRGLHRCSIHWVADNTLTRRVGNVKKAFRGGVGSVVRIAVRCDLSVHDSIYKKV